MKKKKIFLLLAGILSFIVYLAGIYTGITIGEKLMKKHYYSSLEEEMKNVQSQIEELRGILILIKSERFESCKLLEKLIEKSLNLISRYHSFLPYRIEEFEFNNTFTYDMEKLKQTSMQLSINTWIISLEFSACDNKVVPILYFYKRNCLKCIEQGIELDKFRDYLYSNGYKPLIFTVDLDLKYKLLEMIKEVYNVYDAPAIILSNRVFPFSNSTFLISSFQLNKT
ncbi:MAG: hypothetical protein RMJ17_02365 [Candidatus Aenigmarchaeota archaeon]|nr:hypothetical protein [Candidatus Aenigmarchaeota archaeon]MDW8149416.1 hypothetical protein [Candidatus Aenigmarchaeota archaeon]